MSKAAKKCDTAGKGGGGERGNLEISFCALTAHNDINDFIYNNNNNFHVPEFLVVNVSECRHETVRDLPVGHEVRAQGQLRLQRRHGRADPQPDPGTGNAPSSPHCESMLLLL